jgi:rubredoxin
MERWNCTFCEYVYDPALGDPEHGIPAGTPFESLPDTWICPLCGAEKISFEMEGAPSTKAGF